MNIGLISNWGFILLAIYLIVIGVMAALSVGNQAVHVIMGVVAVVAGVLILLGR